MFTDRSFIFVFTYFVCFLMKCVSVPVCLRSAGQGPTNDLQVVDFSVCTYLQHRSSWLSLLGDPRLPNRGAIGTKTVGTKSLINLKLAIKGRLYAPVISRSWNGCAVLTHSDVLTHGTVFIQTIVFTTNTGCDKELMMHKCRALV